MIDQLIGSDKSQLISSLAGKLGVTPEQATSFVDKVVGAIKQAFASGNLNLDALRSGDLAGFAKSLDLTSVAEAFNGNVAKAEEGVRTMAEPLSERIRGGGLDVDSIMKQLGGAGGIGETLSGLASKFLGKS